MAQEFVHLHTHSHYSLLRALPHIKDLVARAKTYGMPALAITDYGNMYGAIEFYRAATGAGIKPIMGCEILVRDRPLTDPDPEARLFSLVLLAENTDGYRNLMHLVTIANTSGMDNHVPRIDREILREHHDGLICLSGGMDSELSRALAAGDEERADRVAHEYRELFGSDHYFIEIQHHPNVDLQPEVREASISLARRLDIPLVAAQNAHYLDPSDARAHDVLVCVGQGTSVANDNRDTMTNDDYSFIDAKTAKKYFADAPDAIENTVRIANRCELELELGTWTFPDLKIPAGTTYDDELKRATYAGIKERGLEETDQLLTRIEYELKVIRDKGFSPYFLIVQDLLRHARKHQIFTTIRGSVAGSMVTYALGITNVDPFSYKLPFERFLNPERPSAPDIDMDYADNRRDEMLEYAREKYGAEKVAQIGTFGKMLAKGAVRDVARALGYPYSVGDRIANLIPLGSQGFPMTIDRAMEMETDLRDLYKKDTDTRDIIDTAKQLEGCARHISVHAAGVVIAPDALYHYVPTQLDPKGGKLITQYDMHGVEDAGLIKFDFLGIRNLAILERAVALVRTLRHTEVDIEEIPLDDAQTFAMLARGETVGLFQLNGSGMTAHLKELRPTTIHDINAMVALYRPGPMEMIPEYIRRKYNPHLVSYLDPRLESILNQSYGVITYQDDVMMIAIELAGYSWLEADKLRKAMGKKIPEVMAEQKEKLLAGFVEHGLDTERADRLWHQIEPFAAYGFNKAHAASYGRVAYQTAYMKAHYPAEYMCAVLSAEAGDTDKIAEVIAECQRMQIPVLPPDVNESRGDFTVMKGESTDSIRFGLHSIKNLGNDIADAIIDERERQGPFASYADFLERVHHKNLTRRSLESLAKCGALDGLGNRGDIVGNIEAALEYNREVVRERSTDQSSLFGGFEDVVNLPRFALKPSEDIPPDVRLSWERELLGLYVSGHPLDRFREKVLKYGTPSARVRTEGKEGTTVVVAGLVEEVKEIMTKKGDKMAFVRLADYEGKIEVTVFPRTFTEHRKALTLEHCLAIKGKISVRNGEVGVIADSIKVLEDRSASS